MAVERPGPRGGDDGEDAFMRSVRSVPTVRVNLVRWIAQLLHQLSVERATLPDVDLRRFVNLSDEMWEAAVEAQGSLAPDEQELLLELLKQQSRADAAAAALRPSLPPGSPRTQLGPYLKNLLEAELVHKRAIVAGICAAADARRRLRLRLNQLDAPPTPRPAARNLWPLAFEGAELGATSVVLIMLDGLALGWADRLMGDLERVLEYAMALVEPGRVRCCVSDDPATNNDLLRACIPGESSALERQERPLLFLWDRRSGTPSITIVDHGMQAWPTLDPVTVVNARDDQLVSGLSAAFSRAVRHAVLLLGQRTPPDTSKVRMSPLFGGGTRTPPMRTSSPIRPPSSSSAAAAASASAEALARPSADADPTGPQRPVRTASGSALGAAPTSPRASSSGPLSPRASSLPVSPRASSAGPVPLSPRNSGSRPPSPHLKGDMSPPTPSSNFGRSTSPSLATIAEEADTDDVAAAGTALTAALNLAPTAAASAIRPVPSWAAPVRSPGTRRLSLHRPSSLSSVIAVAPETDAYSPGTT